MEDSHGHYTCSSTKWFPLGSPPGEGLSQSSRVIDTFIAPSKTFTDINRNSSWWVPWVVISIFSMVFGLAVQQKIGFQRVAENQLHNTPKQLEQFEKLPAQQQAQQMTDPGCDHEVYFVLLPTFIW